MFPNNQDNHNENNPQDPNQEPPQPEWRRWIWPAVSIFLLISLFIQFSGLGSVDSGGASVDYSTVIDQAEQGNVAKVTIRGGQASGEFRSGIPDPDTGQTIQRFSLTLLDNNDRLVNALLDNGAEVQTRSNESSPLLTVLLNFAPLLIIIAFFIWMARRTQKQMNGALGFGRTQAREYNVEKPQVTFDDVAGQDSAKAELVEVVDFLREPDKYIALGARIPRGVLLVGPPGTGKTLMARAVAGEAHVSFFSIAASEFVEMFVGVGASRVRDLFRRAKDNAPSIVFVDEIDAVGRQRGAGLGGGNDEREQTLNQMLAEMDGFDQTESVIVMAATNRPDVLDPALLRPGRFDRQVTVGLSDKNGRLAILKIHTRGKPLANNVDLDSLARGTIGFSGADLANLANEAALTAARRNAKKIATRDFSDAFDRIVLGTESPPLTNENERRIVAYHEAGHALAAALTPSADPVLKVTIVPRGQALGVTAFAPTDELRNYPRSYLIARMLVGLGGRAAEQIIFDEITTGAADDLRRVTDLARRMVSQFGMSEALGQVNFGDNDRQPFLGYSLSQGRSYSEETAAKIDAEVSHLVQDVYDQTIKLLADNRDKLQALAEGLLNNEVIEQAQMLEIIGMSLEEVLPEGSEKVKLPQSDHFALGHQHDDEKFATDADIIAEEVNGKPIDMEGHVVEVPQQDERINHKDDKKSGVSTEDSTDSG
jgi:cell division protease FtsH